MSRSPITSRITIVVLTVMWLASHAAAQQPATADELPDGAVVRFGSTRFLIGESIVFSPDGKQLATGGGIIRIWDAITGQLIRKRAGSCPGFFLWKPDGKFVAVAAFGHGSFMMYEWADELDPGLTDARKAELMTVAKNAEKKENLSGVILSAEGHRVVSILDAYDAKRRVEVYAFAPNTLSSLVKPERSIHLGNGYYVWLSQDGKFLIADGSGKKGGEGLVAFDLTAKKGADKPAWELVFKTAGDHRVSQCLSVDGQRVVVQFLNGDVELWDAPAGKRIHDLPKAPSYYFTGSGEHPGVALSPDGKRLALLTRQKNGEVGGRVVDLDTGKELVALAPGPLTRNPNRPVFSPDGKRLAVSGRGTIRIWNAETGADACPLPGHRGPIDSVVVSADGKTVVTAGEDLTVRAWDPTTGREKWKAPFPQTVSVKFVVGDAVVVEEDGWRNGRASVIDLKSGQVKPLPGALGKEKPGRNSPLAISPDGKTIVSLDPDWPELRGAAWPANLLHKAVLRVWSWPDGELQKTVALDPPGKLRVQRCQSAYFTTDGKYLVLVLWYRDPDASGGLREPPYPTYLERWDLVTGKRLSQTDLGQNVVAELVRNEKNLLLTYGHTVLDAASGKPVVNLTDAAGKSLQIAGMAGGATLSHDGGTLAVADGWAGNGKVRLYDLPGGRLRATLSAGGQSRHEVAFLPDGRLVSAGETALVWAAGAADKVKPPKKP